jgi:hypothetical protein
MARDPSGPRKTPPTREQIERSFSEPQQAVWSLGPDDRAYLRNRLARVFSADGSQLQAPQIDRIVDELEKTTRHWSYFQRDEATIRAIAVADRPALKKLARAIDEIGKHLHPDAPGFPLLAQYCLIADSWANLRKTIRRGLGLPGRPRDDSRFLLVATLVNVLFGLGVRVSKSRTGPVADCCTRLLQSVGKKGGTELDPGGMGHLLAPAVDAAKGFGAWDQQNPDATPEEAQRAFAWLLKDVQEAYRTKRSRSSKTPPKSPIDAT